MPQPRMLKIPLIDSVAGTEMYLNIDSITSMLLVTDEKSVEWCFVTTLSGGNFKLPSHFWQKILDYMDILKDVIPDAFIHGWDDIKGDDDDDERELVEA